jgi:hypothetical protein
MALDVWLDDLNFSADATLAVDGLSALLGGHAGAEPDLSGPLHLALLVRIMHRTVLLALFANST